MTYVLVDTEPWRRTARGPRKERLIDGLFDADKHAICRTEPLGFLCARGAFEIEQQPDDEETTPS